MADPVRSISTMAGAGRTANAPAPETPMSPESLPLVREDTTILEALREIDAHRLQIALVVDGERRLVGIVADGDVRRGLLRGLGLDAAVAEIMRHNPIIARTSDGDEAILGLMREKGVHAAAATEGKAEKKE